MDHLCALQRDFINLRLGTFIHWNSAAVQFHANPDIIDWEFDLENGGEPRRYPFPESDWAPRAPDCDRWAQIAKSAGCPPAPRSAPCFETQCQNSYGVTFDKSNKTLYNG